MAHEDAMEMRAMMSRWDTTRARWALNAEEEAGLLGGIGFSGPITDITSWSTVHMERRMRMLVDFANALDRVIDDETRVRAWLRRPSPLLDARRPIDAMSASIEFIRALRMAAEGFAP